MLENRSGDGENKFFPDALGKLHELTQKLQSLSSGWPSILKDWDPGKHLDHFHFLWSEPHYSGQGMQYLSETIDGEYATVRSKVTIGREERALR